MNPDTKLLIYLYSDANFLAVNILENLLSKNCLVNIITTDTKTWAARTANIINKSHFTIFDASKADILQKSNYVIYCGGFLIKENVYERLDNFISKVDLTNTKTLVLLPFEIFDQTESSKIPLSGNLSIIYLGDLLGPRMDLESDLLLPSAITEILNTRTLTLGVGEIFYPLFVSDVVKTLTKWLFSFGPYGKETFLLGSQISGSSFWQENQKIVNGISINYDSDLKIRIVPRGYEIKTIPSNVRFSLIETYKWLSNINVPKPKPFKKVKVPKPKKARVYPKFLQPLIITLSIIALVPLLTLAISCGAFFLSYKTFLAGQDNRAENLILFGKTFSVLTQEESRLLSYIPIFGRIYKEIGFAGVVGERLSDISVSALPMVRTSSDLFNKVLGNEVYDPTTLSQSLKSNLGSVYQNLSLLQIDTQTDSNKGVLLAIFLQSKFDFDRFRNILVHAENLSDRLPVMLGKGSSKTYLLLFQNNMELRPTGGFIGSYGLITFDGGRMNDLTVSDVYSADGQLNGHVEPPTPIKDYLGEANWWFRDSNWDPDFPTSAKRAEWFLDKEVGRKVDGVIAVDLSPVKDILTNTGSIFLPDFNLNITDKNLYEKTQSEVQDNFFPGTHKKASFLTALSRNLISEVGKLDSTKKARVLKSFFNNLEERHVQIYLHDTALQDDLTSLSWDGSVVAPSCGSNCYSDFVGTVEANMGVNKANYFVSRETSLDVNISPSEIDRKLILSFKNTANPALGLAGKYKVYLRLMIPSDAELIDLNNIVGENRSRLNPEIVELKGRKEVGVLVEVLGGQTESVEFVWRTMLPNSSNLNSYGLYIRKQAGIGDNPTSISINSNGTVLTTNPKFSLTQGGVYTYNTGLERDFFSHISWTKRF